MKQESVYFVLVNKTRSPAYWQSGLYSNENRQKKKKKQTIYIYIYIYLCVCVCVCVCVCTERESVCVCVCVYVCVCVRDNIESHDRNMSKTDEKYWKVSRNRLTLN